MKHYVSRLERMLKKQETGTVPVEETEWPKMVKAAQKRQTRMDKRKKGLTEKNGEIS